MVWIDTIKYNKTHVVHVCLMMLLCVTVPAQAIIIMEPQADGPDFKVEMKFRYKPEDFLQKIIVY